MHDISLIQNITIGLSVALLCGYITHRIGLSSIVGYIVAGIVVSPRTPGLVADLATAQELAEIGVILLMFGVGLHFKLKDLLQVKSIAVPGAIFQSIAATIFGTLTVCLFGWKLSEGIVLGMAISVASTVVLLRGLMDNQIIGTVHGNIAIGWLVVEDIVTVLMLVMLPGIAEAAQAGLSSGIGEIAIKMGLAVAKIAALAGMMFVVGRRLIPWLMSKIAASRSNELFTLSVLVIVLLIAVSASEIFGVSSALGAFLAGMVVGQSKVSHQAAAELIPMRDAFAVLFFVSAGMLFDFNFVLKNPLLIISVLAVIMIGKPLAAVLIVRWFGYSVRTAMTVAIGMAQIGEFSFILATLATSLGMLPPDAQNVLITSALISITINPLLFKSISPLETWLRKQPRLWGWLNAKEEKLISETNKDAESVLPEKSSSLRAVVVGYGPIGKTCAQILADNKYEVCVVDFNIETVSFLKESGIKAIYGDASRKEILYSAGIRDSSLLIIALPGKLSAAPISVLAGKLNPSIKIIVRAHYMNERPLLWKSGVSAICDEETELAVAMAESIMSEIGISVAAINSKTLEIRKKLENDHAVLGI